MEEMVIQDKPGIFSRFASLFTREEETDEICEVNVPEKAVGMQLRANYRYIVTVRRHISSFDEAMAAADGLKRGEQQILNLASTDEVTRQKIVDFLCGVNYAKEGTWEEVGQHIYLILPPNAAAEMAPATSRSSSFRN